MQRFDRKEYKHKTTSELQEHIAKHRSFKYFYKEYLITNHLDFCTEYSLTIKEGCVKISIFSVYDVCDGGADNHKNMLKKGLNYFLRAYLLSNVSKLLQECS